MAEAAGLVVGYDAVGPAPGRDDITQHTVDEHAELIALAVDVVRSLDDHYGREIDAIAARLERAVPPEVDRSRAPSPDRTWIGRGVDAVSGAVRAGLGMHADELDPETRGRHAAVSTPDDEARAVARGMRGLTRFTTPLGMGVTVYDGLDGYLEGETSAGEAVAETGAALIGGVAGGFAAGASVGALAGPPGAMVGGAVGAAAGAWAGSEVVGALYGFISGEDSDE